ncbi:hypothetical protein AncyloWKF20_07505 [Ancylobacter sp. WKF20]|uniref:hypothetical protein n=1 Tax=Ancylobacter sp. WKF20 TaxID=3039801 RepID=UPI002434519A|nr:hypothetical protein [Ancylobacter sp. WKF20]WGD31655.1 hypothetical protein AncyloWKF20_07505 [Ancylobacter sp. WKF20]
MGCCRPSSSNGSTKPKPRASRKRGAVQTTPTTELEAVNILLNTIGESPVNSLQNSAHVDASTARRTLAEVNRAIQTEGWHWNTETDYPLQPRMEDGNVLLPANTMRCSVKEPGRDIVQRGNRLYDRRAHSFTFASAVKADLVLLLEFEDLPQAARELCVIRAARIFQQRVLGDGELYQFTVRDELKARADLLEAESESLNLNILTNSAVARVLDR